VLLVPMFPAKLTSIAAPVAASGQPLLDRFAPSGVGGQFVVGVLLGAIWSPCSGPTLGAAIGLAVQSETMAQAALIMTAFGLRAATPMLVLAYGTRPAVLARRDRLAQLSRLGKPIMGAVLAGVGVSVLVGLDKIIETSLTRVMPDWLIGVTT